jgi:ABC-type oligopeptide transport system substrate-binding subunit
MPDPTYHNFDLFFQREGDAYRVRADSAEGQASTTFLLPFSDMELQNFILTTRPGMRGVRRIDAPDVAAAKRFGGNLFQAVFNGDVQGCWRSSLSAAAQQDTRLRMRLRFVDTPELADLPWEYLFNTSLNRFLALDDELAIVRYLDMPERTRPVAVTLPLRVLVMISNPGDYPRLDVEQEWAQIQEALAPLEKRGLVQIELLDDATLPVLRKKLQSAPYHILHFIGHGAFDRQTQEGVVVLKDENGRGRLVSGQQLGWLVHNYRTLALVILNACEGARADRTDPFSGTAQSLVQQGVPAVVAMQFEITDGAAKTFSQAFYAAVAGGHPVENALFEARMGIFTEDHALEWATPVLYTRAADGHLFDISSVPVTAPVVDPSPVAGEMAPTVVPEPPASSEAPAGGTQLDHGGHDGAVVEADTRGVEPAPATSELAPIVALYREAQEANKKGDWQTAIDKARSVLALDDRHLGAATILRDALKEAERGRLRDADTGGPQGLSAAKTESRDMVVPDSVVATPPDAARRGAVPEQREVAGKVAVPNAGGSRRIAGIGAALGVVIVAILALVFLMKPGGQSGQVVGTATPGKAAVLVTATEITSSAESTRPDVAVSIDTATSLAVETPEGTTAGGSTTVGGAVEGILRVRMSGLPSDIDPQRATEEGIGIASLVYEGLLKLNEKLEPVPAAAESWEVSSDGLHYTLKLRDGLAYSDGTPLTASNFEYAWKRLLDPRVTGKTYSYLAYDIAGAEELDSTPVSDTAKIDELMGKLGVKAIDDKTISFTLRAPAAYFPQILALWVGYPVRQDLVEMGGDSWASNSDGLYYIGNGPYILKQYNDQGISLGANYNYRLGNPKTHEIAVSFISDASAALEAYKASALDALLVPGEIHSAVAGDTQLASDLATNAGNCTNYFAFKTTQAPFNDIRVRLAIAMALDRDSWDQTVLVGKGQQAASLIPPNEAGYAPDVNKLAFDPEAAKKQLESAGFADGQAFPPVTLEYPAEFGPRMEWLQTQLKDNLNISVTLKAVDTDTYDTLVSNPSTVPGIYFSGWCVSYADPHAWLSIGFNSQYGSQWTGWRDDDFDRLTNEADVDPARRLDLYGQAQDILLKQASIIPMDYSAVFSLVKPYVNGMREYPSFEEFIVPGYSNIENVEVAP